MTMNSPEVINATKRPAETKKEEEDGVPSNKRQKGQPRFSLRPLPKERRTNDEIHRSIDMCPVILAILDTPPMQRLRRIKQLSTAELVYHNCTHNRLEHSLGVAQLAMDICKSIQERQPGLICSNKDVLCIKIAGLMHDIGHGPFSHTYEDFVKRAFPAYLREHPEYHELYKRYEPLPADWRHESASLMMIDYCLESIGMQIDLQNLDQPLKQIGDGYDARAMRVNSRMDNSVDNDDDESDILTSRDWVFIKECIWGGPIEEIQKAVGVTGFVGRPDPASEWLYDIVSNRHSGLDVDKVDYFARDERRAKQSGEIKKRVIEEAYVAWGKCTHPDSCYRCQHGDSNDGKHLMICYPEKMKDSIPDFFTKRFELHKTIYKHSTVIAAGYMLTDIFCAADPYYRVETTPIDGAATNFAVKAKFEHDELPLSLAVQHPWSFMELDDHVIAWIKNSKNPALKKARVLAYRFHNRILYKCVADKTLNMNDQHEHSIWSKSEEEIKEEILKVRGVHNDGNIVLEKDDFIVDKCNIHHGCKDKSPLSGIRFLSKAKLGKLGNSIENLPEAIELPETEIEAQLPRSWERNSIRIISRDQSKDELISHIFHQWLAEIKGELEMTGGEQPFEDEGGRQPPVMLSQDYSDDEGNDDDDNDNNDDHHNDNAFRAYPEMGTPHITPPRRRYPNKSEC